MASEKKKASDKNAFDKKPAEKKKRGKKTETRIHPDWKPGITAAEAQPGLEEAIVDREVGLAKEQGVPDPRVEGLEQPIRALRK